VVLEGGRHGDHPVARVRVHVGDVDGVLPDVVEVRDGEPHAERGVARERVVRPRVEDAVAPVLVVAVGPEVVDDEEVEVAVVVEIEELRRVAVPHVVDPAGHGLLAELEIALVDEEEVALAALGVEEVEVHRAGLRVRVARDEEVELPVAVRVAGGDVVEEELAVGGRVVEDEAVAELPLVALADVEAEARLVAPVPLGVRADELLDAVAVEVDVEVEEPALLGELDGAEPALPVVQEEDGAAVLVRGDEVGEPVAVPVARGEGADVRHGAVVDDGLGAARPSAGTRLESVGSVMSAKGARVDSTSAPDGNPMREIFHEPTGPA
jgi:hypothetical protein